MPTYDYKCEKGHTFELFQSIKEKPKGKCPKCGARAVRVISGGAGLIFKGSGFYITDYGKDGKGPRKEQPADAPPPASESKSETPAAPKSEKPEPKKSPKKAGKPASE